MKSISKRISSFLLALVVAVTMLSSFSAMAFAEDGGSAESGIKVVLNGGTEYEKEVCTLSDEWFAENEIEAQAFPFASKKNLGKVGYKVAAGVPFDAFFDAIGISEDELEGAELRFCESGSYTQPNGFSLPIEQLKRANYVMQGAYNKETNTDDRTFVTVNGENATVTPVLATRFSSASFKTYEDAVAALDNTETEGFWTVSKSCYIGNTGDPYTGLDAKDQILNPAADCNGKNAINGYVLINIVTAAPETLSFEKSSLSITSDSAVANDVFFTPASANLAFDAKVVSSDENVAVYENGKVVPKANGSCTLTASSGELTASCEVTVNIKPAEPVKPSKPQPAATPFKSKPALTAVNVSKRAVKLTWKKISGAKGVYVYRATKKSGKYKRIARFTSRQQYTNKNRLKGKTYYYKIRAYKVVKGKKVYGPYSAVKAVKIKK